MARDTPNLGVIALRNDGFCSIGDSGGAFLLSND